MKFNLVVRVLPTFINNISSYMMMESVSQFVYYGFFYVRK